MNDLLTRIVMAVEVVARRFEEAPGYSLAHVISPNVVTLLI